MDINKLDPRFKSVKKYHMDRPADTVLVIEPSDKMTPRNLETFSEYMLMKNCTCHIERSFGGKVGMVCGCKGDVLRN